MGFGAVELCLAPQWPTAPGRMPASERSSLAAVLRDLDLVLAVTDTVAPLAKGADRAAMLARFTENCQLARDLAGAQQPLVMTLSLGAKQPDMDKKGEEVCQSLIELADLAAKQEIILAIRPQADGAIRHPDQALALMTGANHPYLRLDLDLCQFMLNDHEMEATIALLAPWTAWVHCREGYWEDDKPHWVLPGESEFDYPTFFTALAQGGWQGPVCLDVPEMIWKAANFDVFEAAEFSYPVLQEALEVANV